jgi:hypothetical protein
MSPEGNLASGRIGELWRETMDFETVRQKVLRAIDHLLESDAYLLKVDVNERSITHWLAVYLQEQFEGWHVDCEYNRQRDDVKRLLYGCEILLSEAPSVYDTDAKTVYPDIIVHRRGRDDNLLVVEAKKVSSNTDDRFDHEKLFLYRDQLGYRYGLFLRLGLDERSVIREGEWLTDEGWIPLR